ncbi:hypothetical protein K4L44_14300 [Halosquirtibacter laminarini]|uniref:Uncharacterized protein n=1 Tax=Halosquirtibacter laminarini TaxID=3374600 RepID=A0AC61NNZ7_9BACT|nr:hypothetical protein K4L44_14300 [Prolixibacteraceae bacterium]
MNTSAQDNSYQTYPILDLSISPASKALGGLLYSDTETNFGAAFFAPSVLDSTYSKKIQTAYTSLFKSTKQTSIAAAWGLTSSDIFAVQFQTVDYGTFDRRDAENVYLGEYKAASYDASLSYSKRLTRECRAGVSFHSIWSQMDIYNAFAVSFNASVSYKVKNFSGTLAIRNVGTSINNLGQESVSMPLDVGFTIVKSLEHAPFAFFITAHHLTNWDEALEQEGISKGYDYKEWTNHLNLATRLRLSSHFALMLGYNNQERNLAGLSSSKGTSGLSFGIQIDNSRFQLGYSMSPLHKSTTQHNFGFQLKL